MLLIGIGLVPMTPLNWLLVFVHGNAYGIVNHIHLAFRQTQLIGLGWALLGLFLVTRTGRASGPG